jgi:transposase
MATNRNQKTYDNECKAQAVKLAQEIGGDKAAIELGIPKGTMYTWIKAYKEGRLSANQSVHTPDNALTLNEELIELRKHVKEQDKGIRRLKEENEFLEEASAFFAASRRKLVKNRD